MKFVTPKYILLFIISVEYNWDGISSPILVFEIKFKSSSNETIPPSDDLKILELNLCIEPPQTTPSL